MNEAYEYASFEPTQLQANLKKWEAISKHNMEGFLVWIPRVGSWEGVVFIGATKVPLQTFELVAAYDHSAKKFEHLSWMYLVDGNDPLMGDTPDNSSDHKAIYTTLRTIFQ